MSNVRRVVVKIGTSVLVDDKGKISNARAEDFARQIRAAVDRDVEVIVVSSGAVGCGMETAGLKRKPKEVAKKQALASIGQIVLMRMYMDAFARVGLTTSQILLTHEDIKSRTRCLNVMNTVDALLAMGVVPVVNENDTLSFKEIMFGDNDNLSALIAQIAGADLLILLSDVEGLFEKDPKQHPNARMIKTVRKIDERIEALAQGTKNEKSVGGMTSKLEAAKKAGNYGIPTRLVKGDVENVIPRLLAGEEIGTVFEGRKKFSRKQCWIAFAFKTRGRICIDEGAQDALLNKGKSLLPSGVVSVEGDFARGECIEVANGSDRLVARGIVNYSSSDIGKIKGAKSVEIERKLGYKYTAEVIHRDNMVIL
jgi:glutamate 5-kinase